MCRPAGRIEAIWFPFTGTWLKVWTIAPAKPALSVKVTSPYNYSFTEQRHHGGEHVLPAGGDRRRGGHAGLRGPALALVDLGLVFDGIWDIWGQSQNTLLYVKPTTVRIVEAGLRDHHLASQHPAGGQRLLRPVHQPAGLLPGPGPVPDERAGRDPGHRARPALGRRGQRRAVADPVLGPAPARPSRSGTPRSGWTWARCRSRPASPSSTRTWKSWIWSHYTGSYAMVRPEWSKAWALHRRRAVDRCTGILGSTIPAAVSAGQASGDGWSAAVSILSSYDPHAVFSNPFLDQLLRWAVSLNDRSTAGPLAYQSISHSAARSRCIR